MGRTLIITSTHKVLALLYPIQYISVILNEVTREDFIVLESFNQSPMNLIIEGHPCQNIEVGVSTNWKYL